MGSDTRDGQRIDAPDTIDHAVSGSSTPLRGGQSNIPDERTSLLSSGIGTPTRNFTEEMEDGAESNSRKGIDVTKCM